MVKTTVYCCEASATRRRGVFLSSWIADLRRTLPTWGRFTKSTRSTRLCSTPPDEGGRRLFNLTKVLVVLIIEVSSPHYHQCSLPWSVILVKENKCTEIFFYFYSTFIILFLIFKSQAHKLTNLFHQSFFSFLVVSVISCSFFVWIRPFFSLLSYYPFWVCWITHLQEDQLCDHTFTQTHLTLGPFYFYLFFWTNLLS